MIQVRRGGGGGVAASPIEGGTNVHVNLTHDDRRSEYASCLHTAVLLGVPKSRQYTALGTSINLFN